MFLFYFSLCKGNSLYTLLHMRKEKFNMSKSIIIAQQVSQVRLIQSFFFLQHLTFVGSAWSFVFFIPTKTASDFKGFLSQILSLIFLFLRASISFFLMLNAA